MRVLGNTPGQVYIAGGDSNNPISVTNAGVPTALGQKTMANSSSVAIASDQSPVPVTSTPASNTTYSMPAATTVTPLSTRIVAANTSRLSISITNTSANTLYVGFDATVTSSGSTQGYPVIQNATFTTDYTGPIFGIYGTGSAAVPYIQKIQGTPSTTFGILQLPGLHTWFDPTQETAYSNNGLISSLTDFTNHAHTATSSGGNQPTYKTNIKNGKAVAQYLANSNYMQTAAFAALTQPTTIFLVAKSNDNSAGQVFIDGIAAGNRAYMDSPAGGGSIRLNAGSTASMGVATATNWNYYTILFNTTASQVWVNGTSIGTGDAGTNTLTGLTLGGNNGPGASFTGYMGDLILAAGDQTASRVAVEAILAAKWAI